MVSDPASLLQRVPELELLASDRHIARAIASGDPFKVFRALMLARLLRRLPAHAALLRELTRQRRLFARPLKGMPSLGSINSVGFGFIGESEPDDDGSHIALHALVVLFKVPVIPLGAYVVKATGERSWQVYARAPLGLPGWLYTRGLAAAMVLAVGSGAFHSLHDASHQDLLVLNGFDQALRLSFEGQSVAVPAQGRVTVTLPAGKLHATAAAAKGGVVIDTLDQQLKSSGDLSVWNVAGAAPLMRDTVTYYRTPPSGTPPAQNYTIYCGQRFVELSDVQYQFQPAPAKMSMNKHSNSVSVQHLDIASEPGMAQFQMCGAWLAQQHMRAERARLTAADAELNGWEAGRAGGAVFAAQAVSRDEALAVTRRAVRARPDNLMLARVLQDLRQDAGEQQALLAEHSERVRRHPDSADEHYLYASLLSGQAGIDAMQQMHQRFPDHAGILRSLAWRKASHGDPAGALADLHRLRALSPADVRRLMDTEARALLALHRNDDALRLLAEGAADAAADDNERVEHARDYVVLARQLRADSSAMVARLGGDDMPALRDLQRVCAGLAPLDPDSAKRPWIALALALRNAPAAALVSAAKVDLVELTHMPRDQLTLLYGEALRTGQAALAKKLAVVVGLHGADNAGFERYVRGEAASLAEVDLDTDMQAAAMLVRSRNAQLPASERAALRLDAGKADVMHGAVRTALNQWQG